MKAEKAQAVKLLACIMLQALGLYADKIDYVYLMTIPILYFYGRYINELNKKDNQK